MFFAKSTLFAAVAALVGLASAQSTTSSSGTVKAHIVMVSDKNGSLTFSPDVINANMGELVQFHFYPMDHSVAQSTFENPCQPIPQANGTDGFWSGFMPVTTQSTTMPVFSVVVKDTNPMWFYCATGKHCQAGMTGVINPPTTGAKTLSAYKLAAASVAKTGVPTSASGTGGSNSTSTGTTTTTTGSGSATSTSNGSLASNTAAAKTGTNAGSVLAASSTLVLLAAGLSALFAY